MFTYKHLKATNWKKPLGIIMTIITLPFVMIVDLFPLVFVIEVMCGVCCLWEKANKK